MADAAACGGGGGGEGDGVRGEARGLGGRCDYIRAMGASWPSDGLGFWNGGRWLEKWAERAGLACISRWASGGKGSEP